MFHDIYDGFQVSTLENGLSLYYKEQPEVNWFYAGMIVHAGAREDLLGREGQAHFVEHLVGENVIPMTYSQLKKRIEVLGGYGWFGTTGYLSTEYTFHFPNEEHHIQEAFSLFGQMLLMGKLTQHLEEEKSVLLAEYNRRYDHALARSWALQGRPYLFAGHPRLSIYDSAIDVLEEFMSCSQEEIQTFYDTYYVPQNMSIVCIGAIPQKKLLSLLQETPFSEEKTGQRNSLPSPFSVHLPQKHEECIRMSLFSTIILSRASCSFEWVLPLHFTRHCVRFFAIC